MQKVYVAYWSGTGNTAQMAEMVAAGAKDTGAEVTVAEMDTVNVADMLSQPGFALGCPSMGAEELEESVAEPFVSDIEGQVSGKKIVLFGSYGWGDGEWMCNWVERMTQAGATIVNGEGIMANAAPDAEAEEQLKDAGRQLANM